jgi:hypothetical protein
LEKYRSCANCIMAMARMAADSDSLQHAQGVCRCPSRLHSSIALRRPYPNSGLKNANTTAPISKEAICFST